MRVAVVSDIHSNIVALEAVLAHAGQVDAIWVLGDTVGYGPDPDACVRRIRQAPHAVVAGNHDWAAVGKLSLEDFNSAAAAAATWTARQISPDVRDFLQSLPQKRVEGEFTLVHGSPRDPIWEYVLSAGVARTSFAHFQSKYCLLGHTHIPSYFSQNGPDVEAEYALPDSELDLSAEGRFILNPGSVGQPRDENPLSSYLQLDTKRRVATWRRVPYDIKTTQRQMESHGLPRGLIERLASGR